MTGDLNPGEPHPASNSAYAFVVTMPLAEQMQWAEALASTALEGNRMSQICSETLRRLHAQEPVSDRYILGLAWFLRSAFEVPQLEHTRLLKSLAESARNVVDNWSDGDLAGAVNAMEFDVEKAEAVLKNWEGVL